MKRSTIGRDDRLSIAAPSNFIPGETMPEFSRDAATIHYEIVGSGPPLLLIAGTASDSASWAPLLPLLPGRQLILIDNRGSGRTKVEGPLSHAEMIDDAAALLDHLRLGPVDVVGHSLGGFLALGLAAWHRERVARVVSLSLGFIDARTKTVFRDLSRLCFTLPPEDFFRLLYPWLFSNPFFANPANVDAAAKASTDYPYRQSPGDFARQIAALDHPTKVDFAAIDCPVLAVAGTLDLFAPPASVAAAHRPIRDVRLTTIEDAAHSIHWEKPAETAAAIIGFFERG